MLLNQLLVKHPLGLVYEALIKKAFSANEWYTVREGNVIIRKKPATIIIVKLNHVDNSKITVCLRSEPNTFFIKYIQKEVFDSDLISVDIEWVVASSNINDYQIKILHNCLSYLNNFLKKDESERVYKEYYISEVL